MRTLLSAVLITSAVEAPHLSIKSDSSYCRYDSCFSRDIWEKGVRSRFETALASMQVNLVNIVRGNTEKPYLHILRSYWPQSIEIPTSYRGLCKLGKFQAVGWRNVSTWGLLGLFAVALAVTLASAQNEENTFWITIASRNILRGTTWLIELLYLVTWTSGRARLQRIFMELSTAMQILIGRNGS